MYDDRKEFRKLWWLIVVLLLITIPLFALLNYAGIFTRTVVERKVFEQSYQRQEGIKSQIATYEAELAGLEAQLRQHDIAPSTRAQIESQIASIRMQLHAAKGMQ